VTTVRSVDLIATPIGSILPVKTYASRTANGAIARGWVTRRETGTLVRLPLSCPAFPSSFERWLPKLALCTILVSLSAVHKCSRLRSKLKRLRCCAFRHRYSARSHPFPVNRGNYCDPMANFRNKIDMCEFRDRRCHMAFDRVGRQAACLQ
jgi:hypothetical protein